MSYTLLFIIFRVLNKMWLEGNKIRFNSFFRHIGCRESGADFRNNVQAKYIWQSEPNFVITDHGVKPLKQLFYLVVGSQVVFPS